MRHDPLAIDYLLLDDRTASSSGTAWALKRATGVLGERADLRALFARYGSLMMHESSIRPSGFGEAVGGFGSPEGPGYLLCVTLEVLDASYRPSIALVGLWCPDNGTLQAVIRDGDPLESVRGLFRQEPPRSAIGILLRSAPRQGALNASGASTFLRFRHGHSVRLALALIGGAASGETPPAILGITAASNLTAIAKRGDFRIVFSKPVDARGETALNMVESSEELLTLYKPHDGFV